MEAVRTSETWLSQTRRPRLDIFKLYVSHRFKENIFQIFHIVEGFVSYINVILVLYQQCTV